MKKNLFTFFLFISLVAFSSHNRSGEIIYERIPPYTSVVGGNTVPVYNYSITVIRYTDDGTNSTTTNLIQDRCVDTIYFGDGQFAVAQRTNGTTPLCTGCVGCNCDHCGDLIINEPGYRVKKNIYTTTHIFPAAGYYRIRSTDPNRNANVLNIPQSEQQPFYIESILIINSFSGANNGSPQFHNDPIDRACVGKCFTHNPGAFDPDPRDSLSYEMSTPRGQNGQTVFGYTDPPGTFSISATLGTVVWCSPKDQGEYNIAFIVKQWRKNPGNQPQLIGTVLRDMQVLVRGCPNSYPPQIITPADTCVEAGTLVNKKIIVFENNPGDTVRLYGNAGAFSGPNPTAVLTNTIVKISSANGNQFVADFTWQTTCDHVRRQTYNSTFRAVDNAVGELSSYNTYLIRVIPSTVKNVSATPVGSSMKISWAPSNCNPKNNPLVSYEIYRKEGCTSFTPDLCKTGVPVTSGFIYVGKANASSSFFMDTNNGDGLVVGQNYTYLLVALYQDGSETFASSAVCAKLKRNIPLILNVDIETTSVTSGSAWLRWLNPLMDKNNLDTTVLTGPYQYRIRHRSDPSTNFTSVYTFTSQSVLGLITAFHHTNINTTLNNQEYLIEFTAGTTTVGTTQRATSVFLNATASDRRIDLTWNSKTPWNNYKYTVLRKAPSSSSYTPIGNTTSTSYSDVNKVVNRNTYCYKILSEGEYSDPSIIKPLLNNSQELCATAKDLTPPCTPTLMVNADCAFGSVKVSWNNVNKICSDDVIRYSLFFKPTVDGVYSEVLADSVTSFAPDRLDLISGCYAVQAMDSSGNLSPLSPDFCIDNCPEFELPNVFSPNKDDVNDFYKAVKVRQVKEIDLFIFDRWENMVYRTKDPYFKWDGISITTKQAVSEGTFFYICDVFEPRVNGIVKRNIKGYLQVVR